MHRNRLRFEKLECRNLLAAVWTNSDNALDVNVSGQVTALDVLLVVNDINQFGSRELPTLPTITTAPPALVDVNSDGAVGPIDALRIVNALNQYLELPDLAFVNASATEPGSKFTGRTLPNTRVVVEQLAAVVPLNWTFTSDANGEFQGLDIGVDSIVVRATATDPLGRSVRQNFEFAPGQPAPSVSSIPVDNSGPAIGSVAPNVTLLNQNGDEVSLQETLAQGTVVLYFYPKDNTPKCTVQAQDFRNRSTEIQSLGATILGVSMDPVESHLEFANQYSLNFDILSDDTHEVSAAYGVLSEFKGKPIALRTTFIIGSDGIVREIFRDVDVAIHSQRVIDALKGMQP